MNYKYTPRNNWGNSLWEFIHTVSCFDDITLVKEKLINVKNVIPCEKCIPHYNNYLKSIDVYIKKYKEIPLFYWSVDVHNDVNRRIGKRIIGYEEAKNKWLNKEIYKYKK